MRCVVLLTAAQPRPLPLCAAPRAADEALALGAAQGAAVIMSVPCCHKDLHRQFARGSRSSGVGAGRSSSGLAAAVASGWGEGFGLPGLAGEAGSPGANGAAAAAGEGAAGDGGAQEADWSDADIDGASGGGGSGGGGGGGGAPELRALLAPLLRHGLLRQRWLDLATDALRAQLLRVVGYRCSLAGLGHGAPKCGRRAAAASPLRQCHFSGGTLGSVSMLTPCPPSPAPSVDVCEFVSGEHTPRNLLIRAARGRPPAPAARARVWQEYAALKSALGVAPHLEKLMAADGLLPESGTAGGGNGGGGGGGGGGNGGGGGGVGAKPRGKRRAVASGGG
jgi:hypothetical protein